MAHRVKGLTKIHREQPHCLTLGIIKKLADKGTRSDIKISKTQIRKAIKRGASLWGSLVNLGSRLIPMAMPLAKKAIAPIATGALSGLASLGVDNIFGKGVQQGGFLIPQDKIAQLIAYKHLLSAGQKKDILHACSRIRRSIGYQTNENTAGWVFRNSTSKYWYTYDIKCIDG